MLILDDATSAVDVHVEAEIYAALRELLRDRTTIVIAHRVSTIALAERIILLDEGRVAATGTHAQLLATSPALLDDPGPDHHGRSRLMAWGGGWGGGGTWAGGSLGVHGQRPALRRDPERAHGRGHEDPGHRAGARTVRPHFTQLPSAKERRRLTLGRLVGAYPGKLVGGSVIVAAPASSCRPGPS